MSKEIPVHVIENQYDGTVNVDIQPASVEIPPNNESTEKIGGAVLNVTKINEAFDNRSPAEKARVLEEARAVHSSKFD